MKKIIHVSLLLLLLLSQSLMLQAQSNRVKPGQPFSDAEMPLGISTHPASPLSSNISPMLNPVVYLNFNDLSHTSFNDIELGSITQEELIETYQLNRFHLTQTHWAGFPVLVVQSVEDGPVTGFYTESSEPDAVVHTILVRDFIQGLPDSEDWGSLVENFVAFGTVFDIYETSTKYILINQENHIEIGLHGMMSEEALPRTLEYIRFHAKETSIEQWLEEHGYTLQFIRTITYSP